MSIQISPALHTPLTDLGGGMIHAQNGSCAIFEQNVLRCFDAYGFKLAPKKCPDMFDDLHECIYKGKQLRRIELMTKERNRQIKGGELQGSDKYIPSIGIDGL
ncbi:uncharacterized protein LOC105695239 [Orussus abietinus]|uniref:uncharacterized protein LOC105695239 n=1 Tax=Orussus abietinus TaxID=222816 RepID=UPI0006257999|nr:uncharacterized protein LOC105695239 [Orussus abietinus]